MRWFPFIQTKIKKNETYTKTRGIECEGNTDFGVTDNAYTSKEIQREWNKFNQADLLSLSNINWKIQNKQKNGIFSVGVILCTMEESSVSVTSNQLIATIYWSCGLIKSYIGYLVCYAVTNILYLLYTLYTPILILMEKKNIENISSLNRCQSS